MKLGGAGKGAITYYILVVMNALYGFLIAPYLLSTVGESEYGVYKTISSLTASIIVLDLGLGGTMQRYIAKFVAEGKREACGNFTAMGLIQASCLNVIAVLCCIILYFTLDGIYDQSFTSGELDSARLVFIFSALYIVIHIFENVISGVISGFSEFAFTNGVKIVMLLLRVGLYFVVLPLFPNATAISIGTLLMEFGVILFELLYLIFSLKVKIRLVKFDFKLFFESAKYTSMMLVQTIAAQINSNLDNVFVGSILGTAAVSIYSFGLSLFGMFQPLSTSISAVMLPTVTKEIVDGADNRRLENVVIRTGRIQFLLLGSAYFGFLILGREFISLYLGDDFMDVWIITIILMTPAVFELSQNVCISILRARNLLGFRSITLIIGVLINLAITAFGTPRYGYYAAAFGTAASTFIASLLLMNIYYYKKLGINIFRIFGKLLLPTLPGILLATSTLVAVQWLLPAGSWGWFLVKIAIFFVVLSSYLLVLKFFCKTKAMKKERNNG